LVFDLPVEESSGTDDKERMEDGQDNLREKNLLVLKASVLAVLTAVYGYADGPIIVEGAETLHGIAVVYSFESGRPPDTLTHLRRETDAILRPLSIEAGWYDFNHAAGLTFSSRLVVVRFKGNCEAGAIDGKVSSGALGHTHVTEGEVLPFVEVNCDKVWGFIKSEVERRPGQGAYFFGRALARVLAHELYHVIGATGRHSAQGVTKALLTSRELIQGALDFDEGASQQILSNLSRRGPAPAGAPVPGGL
jgi:hypothetical protein